MEAKTTGISHNLIQIAGCIIMNFRFCLDEVWASICAKTGFSQLLSDPREGNHLNPPRCGIALRAAKSLNVGFDLVWICV